MRRALVLCVILWSSVFAPHAGAQAIGLPGGTTTTESWSPPSVETIDTALAETTAAANALPEESEARGVLERIASVLQRQRVLLDELAAPASLESPDESLPDQGPLTYARLDALRMELEAARAQLASTEDRLADTRASVERGAEAVTEAERAVRTAREASASTDLPELRARLEREQQEARRIERAIARADLEAGERLVASLEAELKTARARARLTQEELEDRLDQLERERADLESRLTRTRSNLEFTAERLLTAKRMLDEAGPEGNDFAQQVEARTLWRDAYRRESDLISRAIERIDTRREIWELRARLQRDAEFRRSDESGDRFREIENETARAIRLLSTRIDGARALRDRLESGDNGAAEGATPSRWEEESTRATTYLIEALERERTRLSALEQLAGFALADAESVRGSLTLGDRAAAVWETIVGIWKAELFVVEDRSITTGKLVLGALLVLLGMWLARYLSRVLGRTVLPRLGLNEGAAAAIQSLIFYTLLVTIGLFALRLVNVPLTVFTVLGGALAIGIGFGSQNLMNNFISGLIILAERPVRKGDLIEVGDLYGIVQHIGARSTRLLTSQNIDIIVPNSSFLESNVTNWTLSENRVRTSVTVGVAYGSTTRDVIKLMKKAAEDHGRVLDKPGPIVLFEDFGDNALVFEILFWMRLKTMLERRMVESDLRLRMNELFKEAGIVVAFPQRDIHLDTLSPLRVEMVEQVEPASDAQPST